MHSKFPCWTAFLDGPISKRIKFSCVAFLSITLVSIALFLEYMLLQHQRFVSLFHSKRSQLNRDIEQHSAQPKS